MSPVDATLVARLDAVLPQTQCTRCGYAACLPYAVAIADGIAEINQCPPGGNATIRRLSEITGRALLPLNPANGSEAPPRVAFVDELRCIGCARCLPACPVDAILGAAKFTHTILADRCTGCELCLAPCPVDCIEMRPADPPALPPAEASRARFAAHTARARERSEARQRALAAKKATVTAWPPAAR
ncbi:MAG: hypothetical protein NVSMB15_12520 [Steroidobacteraceae bacterium]